LIDPLVEKFAIPGQYIVALKDGVSLEEHQKWLNSQLDAKSTVFDTFQYGLKGYGGHFEQGVINKIRSNPDVDFIEQDFTSKITDPLDFITQPIRDILSPILDRRAPVTQPVGQDLWNLPRVSNFGSAGAPYGFPSSAGEGVDIYIVDSGIFVEHPDFGGRAKKGANFIRSEPFDDLNGHGTHCAGTAGGSVTGVAKRANLIDVRVLAADLFAEGISVMQGIQYVIGEHIKKELNGLNPKTIVSMSLGGGKSKIQELMINFATSRGIVFVAASGNFQQKGIDSCMMDPSSIAAKNPSVLSVGATDINNVIAPFSAGGKCVSVLAPGVAIHSTYPPQLNNGTAYRAISGTSMATPHVAGALALYISERNMTGRDAIKALLADSLQNVISNVTKETANKFLSTAKLIGN